MNFDRWRLIAGYYLLDNKTSYFMERAKDKLAQFKDDFRRGHIDSYFKKIRDQLVEERLSEMENMELNQQVVAKSKQQNLPELYRLVYHDKKKDINETSKLAILSLTNQTLLQLLGCLIKNMNRMESILIIHNIIDMHYQTIFLNKQNQESNNLLVKNLYELCNYYVGIIEKTKQHKNMINAYINCIKSLLFNMEKDNERENYTEVIKMEYIVGYLFPWIEKLIDNPMYLITLTLVEYSIELSATEPVRQYLDHHPNIVIQLLLQSDPQNNYLKSCALPSLNLATSFMKNIQNKATLIQILQPCLATSKTVYGLTESGQNFYRINTFMYIINNIAGIFGKLEEESLPTSLFEQMEGQNYWIFCSNLLRFETYRTREIVFRILLSAIKNGVSANIKLQNYISETAVRQFVEGLEMNRDEIALPALQIFIHVYSYCFAHVEETTQLRQWIDTFEIQNVLQVLQYSKNKEISQAAGRIISMRRELQRGSAMEDENL